MSNKHKILSENDLPEGYRIRIQHLHQGNADDNILLGARYVTLAMLEDDKRRVIMTAQAVCSKKDNPSRKLGRSIARGRLLKKFSTEGRV